MRYGLNRYVGCGSVQRQIISGITVTFCYGMAKYDKRGLMGPVPADQIGKPREMVLYVAGVKWYPTVNGYIAI